MKKILLAIFIALFLFSCGGGGSGEAPTPRGGGGGGGTTTTNKYENVSITLTTTRTSLPADGTSTAIITAAITADGKPIPDGENVAFSTNLGIFKESGSSQAEIKTSNGEAKATLVAPNTQGTATITVSFAGATSSLQVQILPVSSENPPAIIEVTVDPSDITVYGTATITAKVYDANRKPVKNGTEVNFITNFPGAKIEPQTATTFNGVATSTFTAGAKYGSASIIVTSGDANAIVSVTIRPSKVGSIVFLSASPGHIGVEGSSLPEVSEVKFSVVDNLGNPVVDGIKVSFKVVGPNGGEYVDPISAGTKDGVVTTFLHAGRIAGPVHIIASVDNGAVRTSSQTLYIGSGKPSGGHFTISVEADQYNIMGLAYTGLRSKISAYLADRFGNFVPTNTPVSFFSEAGAIQPGAITNSYGVATVEIQSEKPYPRDVTYKSKNYVDDYVVYGGKTHNPHDGWVTIIAVAEGEEKFYDANGNGKYDPDEYFEDLGEPYIDANDNGIYDPGEPYQDLNNNGRYDPGEPFTDIDGNGKWTPPEFYIDYNQNGKYDYPNGKWDSDTLIWVSTRILFTGGVYIGKKGSGFYASANDYSNPVTEVNLTNGQYKILWLRLVDGNLNPLASGTTVSLNVEAMGASPPKFSPTDSKVLDGSTSGFLVTIADPDSGTNEPAAVKFYINVKITYPTGYSVELPPLFGSYR